MSNKVPRSNDLQKQLLHCAIGGLLLLPGSAFAQNAGQLIPGSADVGRVSSQQQMAPIPRATVPLKIAPEPVTHDAPEAAKKFKLTLKKINIVDSTILSKQDIEKLTKPYIGHEITLDQLWVIAAKITERYREQGYFISRAYVPLQEIENDTAEIKVVEGYIGDILFSRPVSYNWIMKDILNSLKSYKPLKISTLEEHLLQLNDLPAVSVRAALEPYKDGKEGEVRLTLIPVSKPAAMTFGFNNNGSRYLGPYQSIFTFEDSIINFQQTQIQLMNSIPTNAMSYGALTQTIPFTSRIKMSLSGSYAKVQPGYTLKSSEIEGTAATFQGGMSYQWIRQREKNVSFYANLEAKNSCTDILNLPLTRDKIRAVRTGALIEAADSWNGRNRISVQLSQGIPWLGASDAGSLLSSNGNAKPTFTKAEISFTRRKSFLDSLLMTTDVSAQVASGALYSSEAFGFGGARFGRAYDPSAFIGDHGAAASIEFGYTALKPYHSVKIIPFIYADVGKLWNQGPNAIRNTTAASTGVGTRFYVEKLNLSADFTVAQPLIEEIDTPLYGGKKSPRLSFMLTVGF